VKFKKLSYGESDFLASIEQLLLEYWRKLVSSSEKVGIMPVNFFFNEGRNKIVMSLSSTFWSETRLSQATNEQYENWMRWFHSTLFPRNVANN
jgi:hypothetical protein